MRLTHYSFAAAALVAMLCFSSRASAADPSAPKTPKVAVANVVKIFNDIQRTKDLRSTADAEAKALENERINRAAKINDIKQRRDTLNPSAPDYNKLNQELVEKSIELRSWIEIQKLEMDRKQKQQIKDLFDLITAAIAKVATQNLIDIVVSDQKPELPENLDTVNVDQVRLALIQRSLLFAADPVDITSAVIATMDSEYKGGSPKP